MIRIPSQTNECDTNANSCNQNDSDCWEEGCTLSLAPTTCFQNHDGQIDIHHRHGPLLNPTLALAISRAATAARLSLRFASVLTDTATEGLRMATTASVGLTRRTLTNIIASAYEMRHQLTFYRNVDQRAEHDLYLKALEKYTNTGVYLVHSAFSLAEMLAHATFYVGTSTIQLGIQAADELVHAIDNLFGSTETSKALASFVCVIKRELFHEDEEFAQLGTIKALAAIAKATIAYTCLQYVNYRRTMHHRSRVQVVFQGHLSIDAPISARAGTLTASTSLNNLADVEHTDLLREMLVGDNGDPADVAQAYASGLDFKAMEKLMFMSNNDTVALLDRHESEAPTLPFSPIEDTWSVDSGASSPEKKFQLPPLPMERGGKINVSLPRAYPESHSFASNLAHYMRFSSGAYGEKFMRILGIGADPPMNTFAGYHRNLHAFAHHTGIPLQDIVLSSYSRTNKSETPSGSLQSLVHYVAVDRRRQSIVLTLRGTAGLADVFTDLLAHYANFHHPINNQVLGQVHAGFLKAALMLASPESDVFKAINKALIENPTYGLVITGHSLGAAVGTMLTVIWGIDAFDQGLPGFISQSCKLPARRPIHCYGFGAPSCMSPELSRRCQAMVTTVIHGHDPFSCLSLGLIHDFKNVSRSFSHHTNRGLAEAIIGQVLGVFKETNQVDEDKSWALIKTLRADMQAQKLYPPGDVYWINAESDNVKDAIPVVLKSGAMGTRRNVTVTLHHCDVEEMFSEIRISTSMIMDHSPHSYEHVIRAFRDASIRQGTF